MSSGEQEGRWADLPADISSSILSRLFGKDIAVFRAVCRHWRATPPPIVSTLVKHPFLLRYRRMANGYHSSPSSRCELYSPAYNKTYRFQTTICDILEAQIHHSNYGWLLLSSGDEIFFLHSTTGEILFLPELTISKSTLFSRMSFSAPPTCPDCIVFCVVEIESVFTAFTFFIRRGESSWRTYREDLDGHSNKMMRRFGRRRLVTRFKGWSSPKIRPNYCEFGSIPCTGQFIWPNSYSTPVFRDGVFYCLSQDGRMGVFDPRKKKRENMWRLVDSQCPAFDPHTESYLMESSKGELVSVVIGRKGESVRIFEFNQDLKSWQCRIGSLQDQVAFLSSTSCVVLSCKDDATVKGLDNTIHFARFDHENHNVFYSLATRKFHSFDGRFTWNNLCDTQLELNCTWILPRFRRPPPDRELDWYYSFEEIQNEDDQDDQLILQLRSIKPRKSSSLVVKRKTEQFLATPIARPWIILSELGGADTNFAMVNGSSDSVEKFEAILKGKKVYASNNGSTLLVDPELGDCLLLNMRSNSMTMEQLPPLKLPPGYVKLHGLVQFVDSSKFVVVILGSTNLFCQAGDKEWTACEDGDPPDCAAAFQGRIFAIDSDDILVEIHLPPHYRITKFETAKIPRYTPRGASNVDEGLVESCGELLLFKKCSTGFPWCPTAILDVRVYKLDMGTMTWKEVVEDLGDRAFFFGTFGTKFGFGCCASKSGFERNNLYFVEVHERLVYKYDFGRRTVTWIALEEIESSVYDFAFYHANHTIRPLAEPEFEISGFPVLYI